LRLILYSLASAVALETLLHRKGRMKSEGAGYCIMHNSREIMINDFSVRV
jgi:hypothetical protein